MNNPREPFVIFSTNTGRFAPGSERPNITAISPTDKGWVACPDCKQSATGKYLNIFGCARCGWSELGGTRRRPASF